MQAHYLGVTQIPGDEPVLRLWPPARPCGDRRARRVGKKLEGAKPSGGNAACSRKRRPFRLYVQRRDQLITRLCRWSLSTHGSVAQFLFTPPDAFLRVIRPEFRAAPHTHSDAAEWIHPVKPSLVILCVPTVDRGLSARHRPQTSTDTSSLTRLNRVRTSLSLSFRLLGKMRGAAPTKIRSECMTVACVPKDTERARSASLSHRSTLLLWQTGRRTSFTAAAPLCSSSSSSTVLTLTSLVSARLHGAAVDSERSTGGYTPHSLQNMCWIRGRELQSKHHKRWMQI